MFKYDKYITNSLIITTYIYKTYQHKINVYCWKPGDRFTKVIVNRKSKITLKISLRARIRAFH
jgi:hypothetical protein